MYMLTLNRNLSWRHFRPLVQMYFLDFIYFRKITKQVIQLILIMLVGTNIGVPIAFVWEETGVPVGNPPVWLGDQWTISRRVLNPGRSGGRRARYHSNVNNNKNGRYLFLISQMIQCQHKKKKYQEISTYRQKSNVVSPETASEG